jgi:uncharacterized protein
MTATTCTAHLAIFSEIRCTRIRGNNNAEFLAKHNGANVVVGVQYEVFPNCPHYVPDLSDLVAVPANPFVPRPGYEPPPPEWKSRDYLKDSLSKYDPHRKA